MNKLSLSLISLVLLIGFSLSVEAISDEQAIQRYMDRVQKTTRKNWKPNKLDKSYKLTASFKIDKFGEVRDLKLLNKHENEEANKAVLDAIKKSAPFDSPVGLNIPDLESSGTIQIEFDFDYNVKKVRSRNRLKQIQEIPEVKEFVDSNPILMTAFRYFAYFFVAILLMIYLHLSKNPSSKARKKAQKKMDSERIVHKYDPTNVSRKKL